MINQIKDLEERLSYQIKTKSKSKSKSKSKVCKAHKVLIYNKELKIRYLSGNLQI